MPSVTSVSTVYTHVLSPTVWNSLPCGIPHSSSAHTLCYLLKTHCFQLAFGLPVVAHPSASDLAVNDTVHSK